MTVSLIQAECGAPNPLVAAAQQISNLSIGSSSLAASQINRFQQNNTTTSIPSTSFTTEFLKNRQSQSSIIPQDTIAAAHHIQSSSSSSLASTSQGLFPIAQNGSQLGTQLPFMTGSNATNQQMAYMLQQQQSQHFHQLQQANQSSISLAGEQLEEKYRNDMLKNTEKQKVFDDEQLKVDDIQFWQTLAQSYIGPTALSSRSKTRQEKHLEQKQEQERTDVSQAVKDQRAGEEQLHESEAYLEQQQEAVTVSPFFEYTFDERNPLKDQYEDPFSEGLKRLEQGDIPSAALLFEAAVQNEPQNSEAWRYLGTTHAQNEKDMSAIQALRNCLKVNPRDQEARLAISVSLANEMHHHEACKQLLEWLMNHELYRQVGAKLEEFQQLDSELSDDPFYMNAVDQKHYTYVRDKFVDAARMSPNNPDPEVQSSLGVLFNMRGEYEKAVDCFKAALSVKSDDSLLWNRLGATLANGSKPDEAVVAYRKALEIAPGFLRSRYNLAISLIHLNIYDEAAKQLVQILKMQAAGQAGSFSNQIRSRSITSTAIWNTLRTVATLLNKPDLYPIIDGRDLMRCEEEVFKIAEEARCLRPR